MAKKETLYAAGAVVCVVAIGAAVFYLVKANKSSNSASPVSTSMAQSPSVQPEQGVASATPVDSGGANPAPDAAATATQPGVGGPHGNMPNIPAGDKSFFGQVASISGDTVTVTSMGRRGGGAVNGGAAATTDGTTAPQATTITVTLTDNTVFSGGTKDAIVSGARLVGYGTVNSDGSITATNVQINPTRPAGGSGGGWQNHGDPSGATTTQQ